MITGPESKSIVIDPRRPHAPGNRWHAERYGGRYLFMGPAPGSMLFTSMPAVSWRSAIDKAREAWHAMDPITRGVWYGPEGKYARLAGGGEAKA